jgi:hypothetical protein
MASVSFAIPDTLNALDAMPNKMAALRVAKYNP